MKKTVRFDTKEFFISLSIWLFGGIVSLLPLFADYIAYISTLESGKEKLALMTFVLNSSDIIYILVSVNIVAFSDLLFDGFWANKGIGAVRIFMLLVQLLLILALALLYGMVRYGDGTFSFLKTANTYFLYASIILCIGTYISKHINLNEVIK